VAGTKPYLRITSLLFLGGLSLVIGWHWQLWKGLPTALANDTIWHLSPIARVILVALSTCAILATALCCLVKSINFERIIYNRRSFHPCRWLVATFIDLTTTLALLWGAVSLAPQLFYTLYVVVIPGLPVQWVVKPIDWMTFSEFLVLEPSDPMSSLLIGIMMLSILVASIIFWLCIAAGRFV